MKKSIKKRYRRMLAIAILDKDKRMILHARYMLSMLT